MDLLACQASRGGSNEIFIPQINVADARIITVDGCHEIVFEEYPQWVAGIIDYTTGLYVAGEVGFDSNLMRGHVINEFRILDCTQGVTNACSTKILNCLPDTVRPRDLARMHRNPQPYIPCALEVLDEQLTRKVGLVAGQIHGYQMICMP